MRDVFVLPCIAALAIPAFAATVLPHTPDFGPFTAHTPVFNTISQSASSVTPSTAADLNRVAGADAPRSFAFWTVIDLEMLMVRDRIEASPLLRDGMASAAIDFSTVLALN